MDTDEPFDASQPITEDIEIYAKWVSKSPNRVKQAIKLVPLAVLAVMGVTLVAAELRRCRKYR